MKKDKQPQPLLNIGTSLLLVLFLVLCLVTFAALSLSSARSDYSFSEKLADRKTDYYAASNTAEEILAGLDAAIGETAEAAEQEPASPEADSASTESYKESVSSAVTAFFEDNSKTFGNDLTYSIDTTEAHPTVSYEIPVNDSQHLCVTLTVSDGSYEITQWQVVNESGERETQTLQLLPITGE